MKKILFIPHHPGFRKLKIRLAELARRLAVDDEIYILDWHSALEKNNLAGRIQANWRDALRWCRVRQEEGLRIVEVPMLHRPLAAARAFNSFWLANVADRLGIDVVVNGSYYLFSAPSRRHFRYVFDFADFPTSGQGTGFDRFIEGNIRREAAAADAVTASSQGLCEYIQTTFGASVHFVPNGADFSRFRSVQEENVQALRRRHGLLGKMVIAHIGYIGAWVDVAFLVDVFRDFKKTAPEAVLLFVGTSPRLSELKKNFGSEDVIFAGPVEARDIEPYFLASDIGVLPNKKSVFQDLAFHIKIIEHGAARRFVVSSDLEEVKKINLPNVFVAPLQKSLWLEALARARASVWQPDWDDRLTCFDWARIAEDFRRHIIHP